MHLRPLDNKMKFVLKIKESNFNAKKGSTCSHLLTVRAKGADPAPSYGQPDRNKTVFC